MRSLSIPSSREGDSGLEERWKAQGGRASRVLGKPQGVGRGNTAACRVRTKAACNTHSLGWRFGGEPFISRSTHVEGINMEYGMAVGWVTLRGRRKWHQQQCLQPQRQASEAERPGHEKFIRPLRDGGGSSRRGEEGALICPGGRADAPCALALQ
ncbi:hypothetical protein MHYP_G00165720 [Metynnis hypsauchen]